MRLIIIGFVLFTLPILSYSEESLVKKYYQKKDFGQIVEIITARKNSKLTGIDDYRICGQVSLMFGLYKEAANYYQRVIAGSKKGYNDQDLVNYAFALMKLGKSDQILSNSCFKLGPKSSPWLKHMRNIASTRNFYTQKKDSLVSISNLEVEFLPQYGIDYFENRIFYSYSRYPGEANGSLSENALINGRYGELAGIKSATIGTNGIAVSSEVLKKSIKGSARIATLNIIDNSENYFATTVGRKGEPERIVVGSSTLPAFPHNSEKYACAMPFYDKAAQRLYFCSDMPGGLGGWDIYYCDFSNDKWGFPVNLGIKVNTPFDDLFPSVFEDLLIFSSEAREGLGGFDNYAYSLTTNSIQNLWFLNTTGDDLSLRIIQTNPLEAIGVNAKVANYYLSEYDLEFLLNPDEKKLDIAPEIKPEVLPVVAEAPKKIVKKAVPTTPEKVNPTPVQPVKEEAPVIEKPKVETPPMVVENAIPKEIITPATPALADSKTGDVFLGDLYYDLNGAVFKAIHYSVLDSIANRISAKDYLNIVIWSFTDRSGAERVNSNLAYQRALGVAEYLKSKFQDSKNRVYFTVAVGEYFANTTRENNASDRRVEVYASKKGLPYNIVYAYRRLKGETSESIARTFNNNLVTLKDLNSNTPESKTNPDYVYVGIQGIHVASPGETVFRISQIYNCSVDQLLRANHKIDNRLEIAEKIIIPMPNSIM